jgi:hypothetical protein
VPDAKDNVPNQRTRMPTMADTLRSQKVTSEA